MFQQFMQMGAPAAITLVGVSFAVVGTVVALTIRGHVEREDRRKADFDRFEQSAKARVIEHKRQAE